MNRFFDIPGDVCTQLAPWTLQAMGKPADISLFKLIEPIRFRSDIAAGVIIVPKDYLSDLASIPPRARLLFMDPDDPRIELGAWVHDVLYEFEGKVTLEDGTKTNLSREQCDQILAFEAMTDLMAPEIKRLECFSALRLFGDKWSDGQ